MDIIMYISNLLVYLLLILFSGLVLVDSFISTAVNEKQRSWHTRLLNNMNKGLVLAVLLALFLQLIQWAEQFGGNQLTVLLLEGATGRVWLALMVISTISLFVVKKYIQARLLAALLLLLVESMNGHPATSSFLVLVDFVHLASISIWVGGIVYFILQIKEGKDAVIAFIQPFTKLLWLTIALASVSGVVLTVFILPDASYLFYTSWGQLLLIKVAAVLLALWFGYKAKTYVVANENVSRPRALLYEFATMAVVIALAAIISSISPMPSFDRAINVHQMGDELHYTVKLSPNAPGPNSLSVTLWSLKEEGEIANVQLSIVAKDKPRTSERLFELDSIELEDHIEFPGFNESRFVLENMRLPYPTKWQAEVVISFVSGQQRQFSFEFEN